MTLRRFGVGQGAIASIFTASLVLLSNACSGDSSVSFDPGNPGGGGDSAAGGTKPTSSGSSSGAAQNGGSSSAGSGNHAGSSAQAGSNGNAGTGAEGGADAGGSGNDAGSSSGGKAGMTGIAGTAGTAGAAGNGGVAGNGGTAGAAGTSNGGGGNAGTGGSAGAGGNAGAGGAAGMSGNGGSGGCVPKPEVCDGADNNCDSVVDPPGTCPDGCSGATYGGHTYYFCGTADSAGAASTKCTNAGMVMVSIESSGENDFVMGKQLGGSWLGGSDNVKEGQWRWGSSQTLFWNNGPVNGVYENWLNGQPNDGGPGGGHENCMIITASASLSQAGKWSDVACDSKTYRTACESPGQ